MTKGRKPAEVPAGTDVMVREDVLEEGAKATTEIAIGQQMVMDSADVLKRIGRLEAMTFVATVAERVIAETYVGIKESKTYKGLPYKKDGIVATVATLEEFCEVFMPKSRRRCEELAANLHLLGPELYEQAEAIGFRQRDYNALKALPADDQAIVKQAIDAGKFENAIELMQDMAVKHVKEKDTLQKEVTEARANYAALDKVEKQTRDRLAKLEREAARENPLHNWPEQIDGLKDDAHALGKVMDEVLSKHLTLVEATELIYIQMAEGDPAEQQYKGVVFRLGEQIERLCTLAAGLRNTFDAKLADYVAMDKTNVLPD